MTVTKGLNLGPVAGNAEGKSETIIKLMNGIGRWKAGIYLD